MKTKRTKTQAFSLVEVVVALGLVVFVGFALIGLLGVGIQSNRESKEQLQAANITEYLCSIRRAAPTADFTSTNATNAELGFPLPVVSTQTNNFASPVFLTWDGVTTYTTNSAAPARFGMIYSIMPPTNYIASVKPGTSTVWMCLYWPPSATPTVNSGHFEVTSSFLLP